MIRQIIAGDAFHERRQGRRQKTTQHVEAGILENNVVIWAANSCLLFQPSTCFVCSYEST